MAENAMAADSLVRAVKTTAASTAYAEIRRDILSGALLPEQKLRIDAICSHYHATVNPVREALNRLSAEGLVELRDQRGFSVAPVSFDHFVELTNARCLIETRAIAESIAHRTEAWENAVIATLYQLNKTSRVVGDPPHPDPEWETRHDRFHNALIQNCGSKILLGYCAELRERTGRYRVIAMTSAYARSKSEPEIEHSSIAQAALDGDTQRAESLLSQHYRRTLAIIGTYFEAED
ncbi:GntR family transcriptional regulator [Rhizobium rhizogenes]|uniref:GntR family transcriptional regulator n=1 Tax=Rhizobium rhizogenes TaxID=359 RepID=UPI001573B519|nr:GntR family transcriptional regulator [Rhizobium rhizogenes]NTI78658.1 GntR family transcriptional regulator [Rhizobium rhizogenes]